MTIKEIMTLSKKKGFFDVFQVLNQFKGFKAEKREFYRELNKFSYYNAFFRVKDKLLEKGILSITKNGTKKYILLTKKGIDVYNKLIEVNELLNA